MNCNLEEPASKKVKLCIDQEKHVSSTNIDDTVRLNCDSFREKPNGNISDECATKKKANSDLRSEEVNEDDLFVFPPDEDISDMLEGTELDSIFPTVTDRYLTPYYNVNMQKPGDDICIMIHSNRICMVCLAPSHTILKMKKTVTKVDFKVSDKLDRALNKVSGKSKHGAQPLQANSNICTISCSDGQTYTIKCCMIGKLVEVNEALLDDPKLLKEPPHKGGYLAIILPNIQLLDKLKESLLTQAQYNSLIQLTTTKKNTADIHNAKGHLDQSETDFNTEET